MMMIAAALRSSGPVLIAWEHTSISTLCGFIPGEHRVPAEWPEVRFDIVYVLR